MGNLSSLHFGLGSGNQLIQKIDRLHLYSGPHLEEPSYADMLDYPDDTWYRFKTPHRPIKWINGATEWSLHDDMINSLKVSFRLKRMYDQKCPVLWGLRVLCLGDIPNVTWSMPDARKADTYTGQSHRGPDDPPIARLLVDLPSIEHVCQSVRFGPYAFDYSIHNARYKTLDIFSWHPKSPAVRCTCTVEMGPMVLGAVNRYYYPCLFAVENVPAVEWDPSEEAARIARLVECILCVNIIDGHVHLPTKLEFYDYIRYVDPVPGLKTEDEDRTDRACRPATSLARIQALLDECLPECWRGRVVLKDREDAPPCTACGLDVMEQWEDVITDGRSSPGWVLPCKMVHMSEEEKNSPIVIMDW
jgi:hypothetical protein